MTSEEAEGKEGKEESREGGRREGRQAGWLASASFCQRTGGCPHTPLLWHMWLAPRKTLLAFGPLTLPLFGLPRALLLAESLLCTLL